MTVFATYKDERGRHLLNQGLLWEYRLENFDWQKYRKTVAERVISMRRLSDWYAAFDLYGGIRGFRKIARDEVVDISHRDLNFVCHALNIMKVHAIINRRTSECSGQACLDNAEREGGKAELNS